MNSPPPTPAREASAAATTQPSVLPPSALDDRAGPRPDAHRELTDRNGGITARCSLWWRETPALVGHRTGLIGHYAATTSPAGAQALREACRELARQGCTLAIGPMDGSTWGHYRFVTAGTTEPAFFLEPRNPPEWPEQFLEHGFTPLAVYHSTVIEPLDADDPRAERAERNVAAQGITLRPLETSRLTHELKAVFRISVAAFRGGFLYQAVPEAEFLASYARLTPVIDPELVLIATHDDREVGFVFAIPDLEQARRGEKVDTVIIKTLAILPERASAGLGVCLVRRVHRIAKRLGYRRVIHALMHESNRSLNICRQSSRPLRRYTLFSKVL